MTVYFSSSFFSKIDFFINNSKKSPKGFSASKCDVGIFFDFFFLKFLRNFFEEFLEEFFWRNFFGGIFREKFFWRIFLGGFFGRIFWEDFFGRIIWRSFWEEFFWRKSLFTLKLTCLSRFWFLSRFCLNGERRRRARI